MNCLIINIQESVWKEMQRGFNTAARDAVEQLIRRGFRIYVFNKNLHAIHENIRSVEEFHECLQSKQPEEIFQSA
jgi:hypothetical protein